MQPQLFVTTWKKTILSIMTLCCCLFFYSAQSQIIIESKTDVSGSTECDGSITYNVNGDACRKGVCVIVFTNNDTGEESPQGVILGVDRTISGLCAGTYSIRIENTLDEGLTCNFESSQEVVINNCGVAADIQLNSTSEPTCPDQASGTLTVTASDGTTPYTFYWSDGAEESESSVTITDLDVGSYTITVVDACGREIEETYEIEERESDVVVEPSDIEITHACDGEDNGAVTIKFNDNYTYNWDNGATGHTLENLAPGMYVVTITSLTTGCFIVEDILIRGDCGLCDAADPLAITTELELPTCRHDEDGEILVSVSGGIPPYNFEWTSSELSEPETDKDLINIGVGTYYLKVTDDCGRELFEKIDLRDRFFYMNVQEPQVTQASSNTSADGSISVQITGGEPPYNFSWEGPNGFTQNSQNSTGEQNLTGLEVGTYVLTVTDAKGCELTTSVVVTRGCSIDEITPIEVDITSSSVTTTGGTNGVINTATSGGVGDYTYQWSGPSGFHSNASQLAGLSPGKYIFTVTDECGNQTIGDVVVCDLITIDGITRGDCANESENDSRLGFCVNFGYIGGGFSDNGTPNPLDVRGGFPGYTYLWQFEDEEEPIPGPSLLRRACVGDYKLIVEDQLGCKATKDFTVEGSNGTILIQKEEVMLKSFQTNINNSCIGNFAYRPVIETAVYCTSPNGEITREVDRRNFEVGFKDEIPDGICDVIWKMNNYFTGKSDPVNTLLDATEKSPCVEESECGESTWCVYHVNAPICTADGRIVGQGGDVLYNENNRYVNTVDDWSVEDRGTRPDEAHVGGEEIVYKCKREVICTITGDVLFVEYSDPEVKNVSTDPTNPDSDIRVLEYTCPENPPVFGNLLRSTCKRKNCHVIFLQDPCISDVQFSINPDKSLYGLGASIDIAKFDESANLLWSRFEENNFITDISERVQIAKTLDIDNDAIYTSGELKNIDYELEINSNIYLQKKDFSGKNIWSQEFTGTGDNQVAEISIDKTNSSLITGNFQNTIEFGNNEISSLDNENIFLTKVNSNGEIEWAKQAGGSDNDEALSIDADPQGNSFVTGYITGPATFDELTTSTPTGKQSLFLAKYRSDGIVEWVKTGSNDANADFENSMLVTDSEGNVIVAGDYTGTFRLEGSSTPLTADGSLGKASFIAKYSPDGQVLWSESVGQGAEMHLTSIVIDDQDNVTVAGEFSGLNEFAEGEDLISNGGKDIFFAKFDKSGKMFWLKQQGEENDEVIHDLTTDGKGRFAYVATAIGSTTLEGEDFDAEEGSDNCITVDFNCDAEVESEITDATCEEDNGVIDLTISGSSENYYFEWSHDENEIDSIAGGLRAGEYTVSITDGENCALTRDFEVKAIPPFAASATPHAATCEQSNGYIILDITGGQPPFTYAWSTGETTKNISGLAPNTYTVTITDQECNKTLSMTIEETPPISLSASPTTAVCHKPNGTINLSVVGGTAPYNYRWSDGSVTKDIIAGTAGIYSVTVMDAANCSAILEGIEILSDEMPISVSTTDASCEDNGFNSITGSININVAEEGVSSSYNYAWQRIDGDLGTTGSGLSLDNDFSIGGLAPGTYSVTITNNPSAVIPGQPPVNDKYDGCASVVIVDITSSFNGGPLIQNINTTPEGCGQSDGSATVAVSGGTTPYDFEWSNGGTSATINGLSAGEYQVTITAANGCRDIGTAIVEANPVLDVSITSTNANCNTCADGQASVSVTNGTAPYQYTWSTVDTGSTLNDLLPGTYQVTVESAEGCVKVLEVEIGYDVECDLLINHTAQAADCGNCSDGSINLTVTGGTVPYSYAWSNGETTEDIDSLLPGTYTVTVSDAGGCEHTAIIEIASPDECAIEATFIVQADTCKTCQNGFGSGSITTFVTPGTSTPPHTFEWSNGAMTSGIDSLVAGIYDLTITDAEGCTANYAVVVPQSDCDLEVGILAQEPHCQNGRDGVLTATVNGGTASYSYIWREASSFLSNSNPILSEIASVTNITPGTSYEVEVTDGNGCKVTRSGYVENPAGMFINVEKELHTTSSGDFLHYDATIQVTGGTHPYSYFWWHNGSTDVTVYGLLPDVTYTVNVTDSEGCTKQIEVFEDDDPLPPPPDVDLCDYSVELTSDINPCSDQVNGTLTVIVDGGNFSDDEDSPYNILWSTGETSSTIHIDAAGNYSVEVTSFGGCETTESILIGENQPLIVDVSATKTACPTCSNGTATASVSGGTAPFSYQWSNGETGSSISGLAKATYSVTVSDANGCSGSASVVVNDSPCDISVELTPISPSCVGYGDGGVIANVSGNGTSYKFAWSNEEKGSSLSGITAGDYRVTVTNNYQCTVTDQITVTDPSPLVIDFEIMHVSVKGADDGSITAHVTGGTSPYTYAWDTDDIGQTISNLEPNNYTLTITDAKGCTATATATVNGINCKEITLSYDASDPSCFNAEDGSIFVEAEGGFGNFTYKWEDESTGTTRTDLKDGLYTVEVSDEKNCSTSFDIELSEPSAISIEMTSTKSSCPICEDGSASATVSGGVAPYSYLWSNDAETSSISGVIAETYSLTVTDANGCTASQKVVINDSPCDIEVVLTPTDPTCANVADGVISTTVSGNGSEYTYAWSNGVDSSHISGLSKGTYTVTVTNNLNCQVIESGTIVEPDPISITFTIQHVQTFEGNEGSIGANVSGGTGSYTYAWSTGADSPSISGLEEGTYELTVTDSNGCSTSKTVEMNGIDCTGLIITYEATLPSCYGEEDGKIIAQAQGGVEPYEYQWSTTTSSSTITDIGADTYTVSVTDNRGCPVERTISLGQPEPLTLRMSSEDVTSVNGMDGAASVNISGGTSPYTYNWDNGGTTSSIANLSTGTYGVDVIDDNGCTASNSVTVNEPDCSENPLNLGISIKDVTCNGNKDGSIGTNISGGIQNYAYAWSNGGNTSSISNLSGGTYAVTVIDDRGCKENIGGITVEEPERLKILFVETQPSCGQNDGTLKAFASGGTPDYSYNWSNGDSGYSISNLAAGTYAVTVEDANDCIISENKELEPKGRSACGITLHQPGGDNSWTSQPYGPYSEDITFQIIFTAYNVPDELVVSSSSGNSVTTGCIGSNYGNPCSEASLVRSTSFSFTLEACETLTFQVNPLCGCGYNSGTEWTINATCVGDGNLPLNDQTSELNISSEVETRSLESNNINSPTIQIYPNPFNDLLHIDIATQQSQELEVVIVDLMGRVIYRQLVDTQEGLNKLSVDMATTNATDGLYQVLIRGKDTAPQNFKVVRMRQ